MVKEPQQHTHDRLEGELEDLRRELESFQKEKERIRAIVGKIGGVPKTQAHLINALFIIIIVVSVTVSLLSGERWRWLMVEIATVTLSLKIIYLIHSQMRVAHFEFWILSSLEWRINEMMKQLREMRGIIDSESGRRATVWTGPTPSSTGPAPLTVEPPVAEASTSVPGVSIPVPGVSTPVPEKPRQRP